MSHITMGRNLTSVLETGIDEKGFWADIVMNGTYQDVMAAMLLMSSSAEEFTMWRYRLGRFLMHLGLRVLPHGRIRAELSAMMWAWGMKVQVTTTAKKLV
jgi:hypothetical protein